MSSAEAPRITVLGAGSWGTALAMQLARSGTPTLLWGRDPRHLEDMDRDRCNQRFLPDIPFPESLQLEADLETAVRACDHVLVVTPSHAFATVVGDIKDFLSEGMGVAWASKGFEPGSGRFLHQVAAELLGEHTPSAVVTGPSFAKEVALDLPTAVTVAATQEAFGVLIANALHGGSFRAYNGDDVVGAELGGAVKNVLAVATGICDGMGLGDNARAALITRGLAEMMRLGHALGAKPQTLMGLAGMGDLVLTCTGDLSRNRRLGLALGKGQTVKEAVKAIGQVVEGVGTSEEVWRLATRNNVEMPIAEQVHGIIHKDWNPQKGVEILLGRAQKAEHQ